MCRKLIEVSGTPDAGKTTVIETVKEILVSRNIPVHIITEAGGESLPQKDLRGNLSYNIWVGTSVCSAIIKHLHHSKPSEIILVDRGLIDYKFWIFYYLKKGKCSESEALKALNLSVFLNPILIPDLFVGMTTSVEEAQQRCRNLKSTVSLEFHNDTFLKFYNQLPNKKVLIDTTNLSKEVVVETFLNCIL